MSKRAYFTIQTLTRFVALGRGIGTGGSYLPWHRVTKSDPSSRGRSHLQTWHGRQRELLSDGELVAFLFSTMLPDVIDIREQFPLSATPSQHESNDYETGACNRLYPGTLELAEHLGIKHPMVRSGETRIPWVPTTDLLITLRLPDGSIDFIAVAVKPAKECHNRAVLSRLSLERQYWLERGVQWLLVNETLYDPLVAATLKNSRAWALSPQADLPIADWLCERINVFNRRSLTYILDEATARWKNKESVQCAFWHTVWSGRLPFDLKRSWRPSAPFITLMPEQFWQRNPIYCRRSSWPN